MGGRKHTVAEVQILFAIREVPQRRRIRLVIKVIDHAQYPVNEWESKKRRRAMDDVVSGSSCLCIV